MDSELTANSALNSTLHDRQRREQREISKATLQEARRYGMATKQLKGRIRYDYAGHVFIYDPKTNSAITSWKKGILDTRSVQQDNNRANKSSPRPVRKKKNQPSSGTCVVRPVMIAPSEDHTIPDIVVSHEEVARTIRSAPEKWSSNTVFVVDMSGSMCEDDVNGARCRSDGVWTTLAKDYVKMQLEGEACSLYDVVSVVLMREKAQVVIEYEPLDWVLYNKLVSFREWDVLKPKGHGFYKPALEKASEILSVANHGSCALSLLFFSDGKPSDYFKDFQEGDRFDQIEHGKVNDDLVECMGRLASQFGRRLNIHCIGMADSTEKFSTMERMVKEAKAFHVQATFNRPSLSTNSLSAIISSSVATSLSSKTELTSLKSGKIRSVRTDVEREKHNTPDDAILTEDWRVFRASGSHRYVLRVWEWSSVTNDFLRLIDPRCRVCFKVVADYKYRVVSGKGTECKGCSACYFCARCIQINKHLSHQSKECQFLARYRRQSVLGKAKLAPYTYNVAWKRKAFGEGAERLAFKFRFLTNTGDHFVGPVMVAKESRFVEDFDKNSGSYLNSHRHTYHKTFLRTQATAAKYAKLFNRATEVLIAKSDLSHVPFVEFLYPQIFELEDQEEGAIYNVLVEPHLQGKYCKFSDNKGNLELSPKRDFFYENRGIDVASASMLLGRKVTMPPRSKRKDDTLPDGLGIIEEGSEEEDSDDDDEDSDEDSGTSAELFDASKLQPAEYLATFSHFTYERSRGKLMVVDLQGTLDMNQTHDSTGRPKFLLTDPAIHINNRSGDIPESFGRTNLKRKGMKAFFKTHVCNSCCRLFNLKDRSKEQEA